MNADRRSMKIDREFIRKGASKITGSDIEEISRKADDIRLRLTKSGPLGRFVEDLKLLLSLVKDYWSKKYRNVPYWTIAAAVFALLYVIDPADLIPDALPFVGQVDDAAVVSLCLYLFRQELHKYREWKFSVGTFTASNLEAETAQAQG
jgi:uncharacterized membrane protein YkvA (DUF1232 family)